MFLFIFHIFVVVPVSHLSYKLYRVFLIFKKSISNPYIEEDRTTQWPKEKVQKDKQRPTKHTYKIKDRVT